MPHLVECFFYVEKYCDGGVFLVEVPGDVFRESEDIVSGGSVFAETGLMHS